MVHHRSMGTNGPYQLELIGRPQDSAAGTRARHEAGPSKRQRWVARPWPATRGAMTRDARGGEKKRRRQSSPSGQRRRWEAAAESSGRRRGWWSDGFRHRQRGGRRAGRPGEGSGRVRRKGGGARWRERAAGGRRRGRSSPITAGNGFRQQRAWMRGCRASPRGCGAEEEGPEA